MARHGRLVSLEAGQTAYLQGDEDTGLWIVLDGQLRLEMNSGQDQSALFAIVRPGTVFGRSRVGGADTRIVNAVASRASRALLLSDRVIDRIAAEQPAMWRALADALHGQLDTMLIALSHMLLLRPRARIAARLLALAVRGQDDSTLEVDLTQTDLAEMCGLSRKVVNGHLAALEAAGLIERRYCAILLRDRDGLVRAAKEDGTAKGV